MKCGTTSLTTYLSQHNEVFISNPQKLYYFGSDENYSKGTGYYESFFHNVKDEVAIGEGCDDYSKGFNAKSKNSAERIYEDIPNCKIIFLAKHPLKHIESSYLQSVANSAEKLPFNEAVINSKFEYAKTANYLKQWEHYRKRFPKEQIKVCFTEDLASNPSEVTKSCLQFIGITPDVKEINFNHQNVSLSKQYDKKITSWLRRSNFINQVAKKSSPFLKNKLKAIFTKQKQMKPKWDNATLNYVINSIWEDTEEFLAQNGKSKSFWDLEDYHQ